MIEFFLKAFVLLWGAVWWWHQVSALDPGKGFNISINIWWTPSICPLCKRRYCEPTWFKQCTHTLCESCVLKHLRAEVSKSKVFKLMLSRFSPQIKKEHYSPEEQLLQKIDKAITTRGLRNYISTFTQQFLKLSPQDEQSLLSDLKLTCPIDKRTIADIDSEFDKNVAFTLQLYDDDSGSAWGFFG